MVPCQKVLSQSLQNETALTVITGACIGCFSSMEMVLYELKMKVGLSLFEIDINVHVTCDNIKYLAVCTIFKK